MDQRPKYKTLNNKVHRRKPYGPCSWRFYEFDAKGMEVKAKINELDYIKLKSFSTTTETANTTKRQLIEWEKTFSSG